jgi:putative NADH-flavin reductase
VLQADAEMPTYAILGATGGTGSAVLRHLATRSVSSLTLNLFVRSKKKLSSIHPSVLDNSNIVIFEGGINDSAVLTRCLHDASIIFSCIATNESVPGQSIALDTAKAIVSALQHLQQADPQDYRPPTVVMLSAGALNPQFSKDIPVFFKYLLDTALSYAYDDLRRAEAFYKSLAQDGLLNVIIAQPPAIMAGDVPTGHGLSTTRATRVVSYADLGLGMIEMAERGDEFVGKCVTVNATGKVKENWGPNLRTLVKGLLIPGAWRAGRRRN